MQNLNKVKTLLENARKLQFHKDSYEKTTSHPSCDKFARNFNGDTRFPVFSVKAVLCCHTGSYGSSSCSTHESVNNDIAQESFTNYLNSHMDEIVEWMALDIKNKAVSLSDEAEKELHQQLQMLKEIQSAN